MKKNSKKKGIRRRTVPEKPRPVGNKNTDPRSINWSNVGRQRKNIDDGVNDLAKQIKAIREKKGISLASIARDLNVAPATLIKFEDRGHPVSLRVVNAMAEKLGCKLEINTAPKRAKKKSR